MVSTILCVARAAARTTLVLSSSPSVLANNHSNHLKVRCSYAGPGPGHGPGSSPPRQQIGGPGAAAARRHGPRVGWGPGAAAGGPGRLRRLMKQPNLLLLLPGTGPRTERPVYGRWVDSRLNWTRLLYPCPPSLKIVGWPSDTLRALEFDADLQRDWSLALSLASAAWADCRLA